MCHIYPSMSYWDVYRLPVPIRELMIQQHNKRAEETEPKNKSANHPVFGGRVQEYGPSNKNSSLASISSPVRNK